MSSLLLLAVPAAAVGVAGVSLWKRFARRAPAVGKTTSLLDMLKASGVSFEVVPGWETRGRPGLRPIGIMLHHTATGETGDAPSLPIIINGRPGLKGPLANILLGRSGKAYLVSGNIANHGGVGSAEVLDLVRAGKEVTQDAKDAGRTDDLVANDSFYGIEVENSGVGEPYSEEQIQALVKICAAILRAHGWDANRVIHHRQWTSRKIDMSYKGDLKDMIRKVM